MQTTCTVGNVEEIRTLVLKAMREASGEEVLLDLSEMNEADVTLTQILVCAHVEAVQQNRSLVTKTSAAVDELLARSGALDLLSTIRA